MSNGLSESAIVSVVAEKAAKRIARKVIGELQAMKLTLSGEGSELKTTWDEICFQVQCDQSLAWDVFDETVKVIVTYHVSKLPRHEVEAIWLQTDAGIDWGYEEAEDRHASPVCDDDIIKYLTRDYIYGEASNWSNARIRAYIERDNMRD